MTTTPQEQTKDSIRFFAPFSDDMILVRVKTLCPLRHGKLVVPGHSNTLD